MTNEWVTEGCFIFVTYSVKNDTQRPLTVTHPLLSDTQGRKYAQGDRLFAEAFIPAGAAFAGRDPLPPGETRLFCSIYEVAHDSVPARLEVYRRRRVAIREAFRDAGQGNPVGYRRGERLADALTCRRERVFLKKGECRT
jgi:hypothetical protein